MLSKTPVKALNLPMLGGLVLAAALMIPRYGHGVTEDLKIPNLGESSTSLFSSEFEYNLGRSWLKAFRRQAPTVNDPLLYSYLESIVFDLVTHSDLQDRRIELVIVDNPNINAFAVPGGVIGVHTGLFQYAQTEDEFATVMAHEIAHLSQRHFSRGSSCRKASRRSILRVFSPGFCSQPPPAPMQV